MPPYLTSRDITCRSLPKAPSTTINLVIVLIALRHKNSWLTSYGSYYGSALLRPLLAESAIPYCSVPSWFESFSCQRKCDTHNDMHELILNKLLTGYLQEIAIHLMRRRGLSCSTAHIIPLVFNTNLKLNYHTAPLQLTLLPHSYTCTVFVYYNRLNRHIPSTWLVPYPHERGPTTECQPTPNFRLNFLLRSRIYSNMRPCVAALENAAQMAGLWGLNFKKSM